MLNTIRLFFALAAAAVLCGCASSFAQPSSLDPAIWGPPPANYEATIREHFETVLKDPESARYRFSRPVRAYGNHGLIDGGGIRWVGYLVHVTVNAKNSYGGYTGAKPYMVLMSEGGRSVYKDVPGESHPLITQLEAE